MQSGGFVKKLLCLLLASMLTGPLLGMDQPAPADSAYSEQLPPPEFRAPPLVMQFARYGARMFNLEQLPMICDVSKAKGGRALEYKLKAYAASINKDNVARILKELQNTKLADPSGFINSPICTLMERMLATGRKPQDIVMLFSLFFPSSYGCRKIITLHELWHTKQRDRKPVDSVAYQEAEQEADMQAVHAANCQICAKDYATRMRHSCFLSFLTSGGYAIRCEILSAANKMPKNHVCSYHELLMKRPLYRMVHNRMFRSTISLTCCGLGLAGAVKSHSIPAKIAYAISGFTVGLATSNILFFGNLLENWLGQDIEEKIARGELEP